MLFRVIILTTLQFRFFPADSRFLQDPKDPRTKVPLDKMKPVYYRARGWKDGIPTWHRLKTLGIKISKSLYDAAVKEAYK